MRSKEQHPKLLDGKEYFFSTIWPKSLVQRCCLKTISYSNCCCWAQLAKRKSDWFQFNQSVSKFYRIQAFFITNQHHEKLLACTPSQPDVSTQSSTQFARSRLNASTAVAALSRRSPLMSTFICRASANVFISSFLSVTRVLFSLFPHCAFLLLLRLFSIPPI